MENIEAERQPSIQVDTMQAPPERITVLGATGSIGRNTLDLIAKSATPRTLVALTANRDIAGLIELARRFRPEVAVIADDSHFGALKSALADTGVEVAAGPGALVEAAQRPADWVMAAIVGAAGLAPTLAAVGQGGRVALANKECLVCAGALFTDRVAAAGATLLPVDSEHNAIFQVFDFARPGAVERIILTASGGPFRGRTRTTLAHVTPAEAVAHPNWSMGAKISVDSATLMNKGLELIEAAHLFPVPVERIEVVVHPQSVIHSMVEYVDGSILAQLGTPDMRTPIASALAWPQRMRAPVERLDFSTLRDLTFEAPDMVTFPLLQMARDVLRDRGAAPAVLNAANEIAVEAFLAGRIGFLQIADVVRETLDRQGDEPAAATVEEVVAIDFRARELSSQIIGKVSA